MTNNHPLFVEKSSEKISSLFQSIQLIRHDYNVVYPSSSKLRGQRAEGVTIIRR